MFDRSIHHNEPVIQDFLYDFARQMNFGKWLKEKRAEARISGPDFERGGVSRQYISNLETGHVERPSREYAIKIAQVLRISPDEALLAAGYAPDGPIRQRPKNLEEFIEILESWGYVFGPGLFDKEDLQRFTADDFEDLLERVRRDVINEIEIKKRRNR